ncbi:citrate synthase [Motilibacter rhizosphaerae]|uniref:citrate synthase (unknown stereospecificity) n=1 Tax=Motilibacter rhizosphaerae TaxID=598652 RepID=A0A4Q7NS07_9ACTN|nr:citrate/2-methylcitrate synthase [Motilibacter rhizosphaerae]RZS89861.1 citrate synthase [Motilibacter rhizosphaerae]
MNRRISTEEAARRLGVKVETVYAYVSRGLLESRREPAGGSTFALADVEELLAGGRRRASRRAATFPFRSVDSALTEIRDGRLLLRGRDLAELSRDRSFEQAAALAWGQEPTAQRLDAPPAQLAAARRTVAALPPADPAVRLRVAAAAAAAADPLRYDLSPASVVTSARGLLGCLLDALGTEPPGRRSAASRLWRSLSPTRPPAGLLQVLDAALVLLVDHGLAASTVAARVAASTRADPYAVVSAGMAVLEGPLHGGASREAHGLLLRVVSGRSAEAVVGEQLRSGRGVPGLGHPLYPEGDPRAAELLDRLEQAPAGRRAAAAARAVAAAAGRGGPAEPNVDLGLAALTVAGGLPAGAGEVVFAVSRTVGWTAHALEEYAEEPLRWRGREVPVSRPLPPPS